MSAFAFLLVALASSCSLAAAQSCSARLSTLSCLRTCDCMWCLDTGTGDGYCASLSTDSCPSGWFAQPSTACDDDEERVPRRGEDVAVAWFVILVGVGLGICALAVMYECMYETSRAGSKPAPPPERP